MRSKKAFTLIELLVVISIIALLIGILLPALGAAKEAANRAKNSSQIHSIAQAMRLFAAGNKDVLPGYTKDGGTVSAANISYAGGNNDGITVEGRYAILLEGDHLSPQIILSPADERDEAFDLKNPEGKGVQKENYSYSLLKIRFSQGARQQMWTSGSVGTSAVLICDRLTGGSSGKEDTYKSFWSGDTGSWQGAVGFGDAHAEFMDSPFVKETRFTTSAFNACEDDDLFKEDTTGKCAAGNNANMVQTGHSGVTG